MMYRHILAILCFSFSMLQAQVSIPYLLSVEQQFTEEYQPDKSKSGVRLKMQFARDTVLNKGVLNRLAGKNIVRIDLVYSDYRTVRTFDQPGLNEQRLAKLKKLLPAAFENAAIEWNFIAQTGCSNPETCSNFFHGFVIYYQETPTATASSAELKSFDYMFKTVKIIDTLRTHRYTNKSMYKPWSEAKREAGILYENRGIWLRPEIVIKDSVKLKKPRTRTRFVSVYDTSCDMSKTDSIKILSHSYVFCDSVVTAVLNRNKHWKNMTVALDVTGSMSPYTQQVLAWLALQTNIQKVRSFTFFNDGDNKSDGSKKTGRTGGIYHCTKNDFHEIVKSARYAMSKGSGGDGPENDMEAMIEIQNTQKKLSEIILIADNWANMRDYKLIENLKVPVRVILCGAMSGINAQYLQLARKTGGSVHTIESDILHLSALSEGDRVKIDDRTYRISGGEFLLDVDK